ncbi:hypothetical protein C1646_669973 [Rhizophagus diaphanus]|nr:hypothetical protein C1646_669973 [Rhizophagus diaphanus] [Rhizophagus sp. MUCL 43196]
MENDVNGLISSKKKFIVCGNWKAGDKNHQNDKNNTIDECFIVRPNNTRSDECFPVNLKECPFITIVSVGQHNHLSPSPYKMPYNIKTQLQKIIDNEYILDLTARKFLTGFRDNGQYIILCATKQQLKAISEQKNIDKNKYFSSEIRSTMCLIPTLNTQEVVLSVFNKIQLCDEPEVAEKKCKGKQPLKSSNKVSSASKKQRCNSRNKENENEIIIIDDDLFDQ